MPRPHGVEFADACPKDMVIGLQELPRVAAGWKTSDFEQWTVIEHRSDEEWRGSGVMFQRDRWTVMRRKACNKGIWIRLKNARSGMQVWIGSMRFTQGCTQHAQEVGEALRCLPTTTLPIILTADANATLGWYQDKGELVPRGLDGKGLRMLGQYGTRGLKVLAPGYGQRTAPTSRPRKQGVKGSVIDCIAAAGIVQGSLSICQDSCHVVGTDHELLFATMFVTGNFQAPRRMQTRPRVVVKELPVLRHLDQAVLKEVAKECTKPKRSHSYKDPQWVRELFKQAKAGREPTLWKVAMKGRCEARKQWESERMERAVEGDWQALRASRRRQHAWEPGFAEAMQGDPHDAIHHHLAGIYAGEPIGPWNPGHEPIVEVEEFNLKELQLAADKGKLGKAVGPDGVPHELLRQMAYHEEVGPVLLAWYNKMLRTGELPKDWSSVIMVVLPKVANPSQAKEVRPISMGSAASKLFSRVLLTRTLPILGEAGSRQCAGAGRQPCDYIFVAARTMSLEREWRFGLSWIKLDLAKAYDGLLDPDFIKHYAESLATPRLQDVGGHFYMTLRHAYKPCGTPRVSPWRAGSNRVPSSRLRFSA